MPDIFQTLRSTDLDFLKRLARAWKIELAAQEFSAGVDELQLQMKDKAILSETISELPSRAEKAWEHLLDHNGRESWSIFTRHFGELRTFGLAKRVREEPDLHPVSATEELWYRGLIGRAFLDLPPEPQEYAFIPDEFLSVLRPQAAAAQQIQLRPASIHEKKLTTPATDSLLDDATELLAALRMNRATEEIFATHTESYAVFLTSLLQQAGILITSANLDANKVKDFLALPRGEALLSLFQTWKSSKQINDLRMLPGLVFEGNWSNDVFAPRELVVGAAAQADPKIWWSLSGFISQVKTKQPDFQRLAGDYESWFIRNTETNEHLHGAVHWDEIEGALLYYLFTGPLHWLGVVDLAKSDSSGHFTAFKLSGLGSDILNSLPPARCKAEDGIVSVGSEGTLHVPNNAPRAIRYQLARFSTPLASSATERKYRITPASLKLAAEQGLKVSHLLQLFQQAKVKNMPPSLVQQLERWEKYGSEANVEKVILLRLARPELLPLLQKNSRASQCISAVLNNQTLIIKPGKVEQIRQSLAELGLLTDVKIDSDV
jgi:hypothetical protein